MKIITVVGARPQFVKAAVISRVLRSYVGVHEVFVHTGQHYDHNMSDLFFSELDIPHPDYNLGIGSGSHSQQTGLMIQAIGELLEKESPDFVLIYGDTNSTLAGALAASKLHIPVAHVEAGLRSFNRSMPEELNRVVADHVSDLLFAPTQTAVINLKREGLEPNTRLTGDVMFDSVLFYRKRILEDKEKYTISGLPEHYLLATIHRAGNTDDPLKLHAILKAFEGTGQKIVWPLHPRTRKMLQERENIPGNVMISEPVGYLEMLSLVMGSDKVLTDSGGLQKEAYFLGKQCITIREETEWVETLHDNWNVVAGTNPEQIIRATALPHPSAPAKDTFGDGHAAEKILSFLIR